MIRKIIARLHFKKKANVNGYAVDKNKVTFFVQEKKDLSKLNSKDVLPKKILGKKTDVVEIGEVHAQSSAYRVMRQGSFEYGTLGMVVTMRSSDLFSAFSEAFAEKFGNFVQIKEEKLVLTNMHVAFETMEESDSLSKYYTPNNRNDQYYGFLYDRGIPDRDAALLRPDGEAGFKWIERNEIAYTVGNAKVGDEVRKKGGRTGLTKGKCVAKNATIVVNYKHAGKRTCKGCDLYQSDEGLFSNGGDSGSVIYKEGTNEAVAQIFAGGDGVTIAYPLLPTLRRLGIIW